ncbi:uncharacterized protein LOC105639532 [Jatropha curcas]|uniref:uncharacterized protein LOC105639532 n=1 Tax=Jatropha curcas TaxID=180498 RepID=UPI0005FB9710|nr:uncharacterized protein LOC105639532 [Jatropha curcas]
MGRNYFNKQEVLKWKDGVGPRRRKRIKANKLETSSCVSQPSDGNKFQVTVGEKAFVVSLQENECSCRAWQLSGVPCNHAISSIHYMRHNLLSYLDEYLHKEAYMKTYQYGLTPFIGEDMWAIVDEPPILPPEFKKKPGRLKTTRIRADDEELKISSTGKISKKVVQMKCQHWGRLAGQGRIHSGSNADPSEKILRKDLQ